ncbi:MAG: Ldh family oxidoreductase [Deltaproteobacteria bacterium]|nr:MAG: Ldh family oxidoreductase [Deltaproteobacteria bacterium]
MTFVLKKGITAMPANNYKKDSIIIASSQLHHFIRNIFLRNGLSEEHAETAAYALVKANLRGVDSHGVARVPMYCERLRLGVANPQPQITVSRVASAVALVDGDDGLGLIVGKKGMAEAIHIAHEFGIGLVGVKHSGHYGMAALYILQAIEADCVGFAFTNASPALPVWGGRDQFLGTNPFAAGAPTDDIPPFVVDMACSVIARGKLKFAAQRGEPIPEGLALDKNGRPTTDGKEAFEGVVLPFGGVKGTALSMLMEVLSGVLTGAAFGGEVRNPFTDLEGPQGTGHFFLALKADLFRSFDEFKQRMQTLTKRVKAQTLAEGFEEIQIPGEPEQRTEIARLKNGIPLTLDVVETLKSEAELAGLSFPTL